MFPVTQIRTSFMTYNTGTVRGYVFIFYDPHRSPQKTLNLARYNGESWLEFLKREYDKVILN